MIRIPAFYIILFFFIGLFFISCDRDKFAGNIDDVSFSCDTLSLGTVFSTVGSPSYMVTIRNKGDKKVRIDRIFLKSGGESGFRVNLDGENNIEFGNVEIPSKDSLYLFVEFTGKMTGEDTAVFKTDEVILYTDKSIKKMVLGVNAVDAYFLKGVIIDRDTVFAADKPYVVYDSLYIKSGAVVTIDEGAVFFMHDKSFVKVSGQLRINGTTDSPVTFRGDRLDNFLPDFPYEFYPGQWHGIILCESSYENSFNNVRIRGAEYGLYVDSSSVNRTKFVMENSVVHNMTYACLELLSAKAVVSNSLISNAGDFTVAVSGGSVDFNQCTIVNYQRLVARTGPCLYVTNSSENNVKIPVLASFSNSIIYGNSNNEITIGLVPGVDSSDVNISFYKDMIKTEKDYSLYMDSCYTTDNIHFISTGYESEKYIFNFRLDSVSPALNIADKSIARSYPYDLDGCYRLNDSGPDLGAYEYHE